MRRPTLFVIAAIVAVLAPAARAQLSSNDLKASAVFADNFQITPSTPTVSRPLLVDQASTLSFSAVTTSQTLKVTLVTPSGSRYNIGDPANAVFQSGVIPVADGATTGAGYVATLATPTPGNWTVTFTETKPKSTPTNVATQAFFNNTTRAAVFSGGDSFPAGGKMRIALAAFDGVNRLHGLTVSANAFCVSDSTIAPLPLTFTDDGTGADETASNGIYEAYLSPTRAGTYVVQATISGNASTGAFRRTAAVKVTAAQRNAQIQDAFDDPIDFDGDGLADQVGIVADVAISQGATYQVSVQLRASNGHVIERSTEKLMGGGVSSAEVFFSAQDIQRDLGVDGPYDIAEVKVSQVIGNELTPVDVRYDLGKTSGLSLSDLQHPALRLDPAASATGVDKNGNHLFDELEVDIGITADVAGSYDASVSLLDPNGHEIGFANGTLSLVQGDNAIAVHFDGSRIGANGVDGPYVLSNLIVFGEDKSLVVTRAFTTQAFHASDFEGFKATAHHHAARH